MTHRRATFYITQIMFRDDVTLLAKAVNYLYDPPAPKVFTS